MKIKAKTKERITEIFVITLFIGLIIASIVVIINAITHKGACATAVKDCDGKKIISECHCIHVSITDVKHCFK